MKILWKILRVIKIGLYLGVIFMHFMDFSEGQGTEWGYFLEVVKFQIFFGGAWGA